MKNLRPILPAFRLKIGAFVPAAVAILVLSIVLSCSGPRTVGGNGSFAAETEVLTPAGGALIDDIAKGTLVTAWDYGAGKWSSDRVTAVRTRTYRAEMIRLEVAGESIRCTPEHPFWVVSGHELNQVPPAAVPSAERGMTGRGRWVEARDLLAGDVLLSLSGEELPVQGLSSGVGEVTVYNLELEKLSGFAVGAAGILVSSYREAADVRTGGGGCFAAGTKVMSAGGTLAIEEAAAGLQVYARGGEYLSWELKEVLGLESLEYEGDVVKLEAGGRRIEVTGNHPFWVANGEELEGRPLVRDVSRPERAMTEAGRWVEARDLRRGDALLSRSGERLAVDGLSSRRRRLTVYNLKVADYHSYAVSPLGILVHNKGSEESPSASADESMGSYGPAEKSAPAMPEGSADSEPKEAVEPMAEMTPAKPATDEVALLDSTSSEEPAAETPADAPPRTQDSGRGITRYLSADDSNSTASAVIARKMIRAGRYVQPAVIRTYEFLNYYDFDYPAAQPGGLAIYPEMRSTDSPGEYTLQIGARSEDLNLADLGPLNVVFLLDSSGSMVGSPIALAKELLRAIVGKLRSGDRISVVTFNRVARVLLEDHPVGRGTPSRLEAVLSDVRADDVTDLETGIAKAYEVASATYDYRSLNRVVLVSDGAANAGKLAAETIAEHAADSDRQGIYLAGIGLGEGFNDRLMDVFTDRGRGAYLFLDSAGEIDRLRSDRGFIGVFSLALKDVRMKVVLPAGWSIAEFHGEQISATAADVIPQYLAPNDQMIYHLVVSTEKAEIGSDTFEFEAEYTPIGGEPAKTFVRATAADMLKAQSRILKGDAVVEYAELLKSIAYPLEANSRENLRILDAAVQSIEAARRILRDDELAEILSLLSRYRETVDTGELLAGSRDKGSGAPDAVMGVNRSTVRGVEVWGARPRVAVQALERLGESIRLVPMEGYRFLALSSGPVGNPSPAGSGQLSRRPFADPMPEYMGSRRAGGERRWVYDLHRLRLDLKAPPNAKSFSFDFNFFSAEYPDFIQASYNDTFYAVITAPSTNQGRPTNISFDANNNSIEVDNNYFENPFHPIPNTNTGFDLHGSTGWLRTSWPIRGGEEFSLTFSVHDEGDAIYDSMVLLDNFQWLEYDSTGTTDPLN